MGTIVFLTREIHDIDIFRPIKELNLLQLNNDGYVKFPQIPLSFTSLFVQENRVVDLTFSILQVNAPVRNCITAKTLINNSIYYPLHSNHFRLKYDGSWIDGDSTKRYTRDL